MAGIAAASLLLAACGTSGSPTILNTEKVERAIEAGSLAQRGEHVQVSCPSGVQQRKGATFHCTTVTGGRRTRFVVTQRDDAGRVHYRAM